MIPSCASIGIAGVAVVSALVSESDVFSAAKDLRALFQRNRKIF
ncbi:hypothetical protein [Sphaerochaeta pleomorpha]|nr:hypothetical protein [Sphaerochaeta pleomorpha]